MAFDPVPWAIGNGAEVSDETGRVFANIATRDAQGIALPGDMKVTALGTPGAAVVIAPGGVVIRNVQAPGQSYIGRAGTSTQVAIAATGGAARSDLIIARVRDPDFAPWQPYTDPGQIANGPYFEPFVISGVSASTQFASEVVSYSAEALARIDIPANTAAITAAMIKPLRRLVSPRSWFAYDVQPVAGTQNLALASTSYTQWPTNTLSVAVPSWATHAQVGIDFLSILSTGLTYADLRAVFGGAAGPAVNFDNDTSTQVAGGERVPFTVAAEFDVQAVQGQTLVLKTEGRRLLTGTATGTLRMDFRTQVRFDVRFSERVV